MELNLNVLPGTTSSLALQYRLIVLAGELGDNGIPDRCSEGQTAYVNLPEPPVLVFVGDMNSLLQHVMPMDKSLTFRPENLGQPTMPF